MEERRKSHTRASAQHAITPLQDRRAHERLNSLEQIVAKHISEHAKFEKSITDNTELIKQIVENTSELVTLYQNAISLRNFLLWIAPVVAIFAAAVVWIRSY